MTMAQPEVPLIETPLDSVKKLVENARDGFRSRRTFPLEYRQEQLRNLRRLICENQSKLLKAVWTDLHKSEQETLMTEVNLITSDIDNAINSLPSWMSLEPVQKDLLNKFNSAYLLPEPYGVVLVIAPWNYPLMLTLQPLTGAIAAGNACVLKLSEFAVATSNILAELIPAYLDKKCYSVVTGGVEVAKEVCSQRFDYIFFTGSTSVARHVMRFAAEHLTPLTLELGGKSPCIVADDADLNVAGRRIMWGKCLNSGQSCVAPDYILCSPTIQNTLAEYLRKAVREFFGEDPKQSKDFGRIINRQAFERIQRQLDSMRNNVFYGGDSDAQERYICPTILTNVNGDDSVMSEEIFGPLLPIVPVENVQKAIEFINNREKALALYVFTNSPDIVQAVTQQISCGGITHNDTMLHCSVPTLPFGGIGYSGFGIYHGKFSFDTFTHRKPVLSTSTRATLEGVNNIRYPPYSQGKLADAQRLQTEGGVSRALHLANLLTRSILGRARYRQPSDQTKSDVPVEEQQESNTKTEAKK